MNIQYIKHNDINIKKYDYCIENSSYGTIYAMSWYLDVVSPGWDILMADDYNYVMPIPVKKKYFFKYAIQPPFCQQLGVFSLKELSLDIFDLFIKKIPYSFYKLQLNIGNVFENYPNMKLRSNYTLDLDRPYEEIRAGYSKNCVRNLKKAQTEVFLVNEQTSQATLFELVKSNYLISEIVSNLDLLDVLIHKISDYCSVDIRSAVDAANNENPLACILFLRYKNRSYYLLPVSTKEGKQKQCMTFLLDNFIQSNTKNNQILDFEGSSIPNVAEFYRRFGAKIEFYPALASENLLSKLISFLKTIMSFKKYF